MLVRRVGWDAQRRAWFEWGVGWDQARFIWTRIPTLALAHLSELPEELLSVLPDRFTTEISFLAEQWWGNIAQQLSKGHLMTLDYGLRSDEFFAPQRANGTLRAYRGHKICQDLLADPGEQDLTAHVNFSRIQAAAEKAGLVTEVLATQAEYVVGVAKHFWTEAAQSGEWTAQQNRELRTLMHPEHLGRAFRVLVQRR